MQINDTIFIDEKLIRIKFIRSRGPGGQNVNKVNTRAQLSFDLKHCDSIPPAAKNRLKQLAGGRLTSEEIIILESDRNREQIRNRQECLNRLRELVNKALVRPKKRIPTKPSKAAKQRRLDEKKHRSQIKTQRTKPSLEE